MYRTTEAGASGESFIGRRASASGRRFLGDFQEGWICFEGLDSTARRRLPRCQTSWASVTEEELQRLLSEAIDAPGRETQQKDKR